MLYLYIQLYTSKQYLVKLIRFFVVFHPLYGYFIQVSFYPVIPFRLRQGHEHHKNLTGCSLSFRNFQIKNVPS